MSEWHEVRLTELTARFPGLGISFCTNDSDDRPVPEDCMNELINFVLRTFRLLAFHLSSQYPLVRQGRGIA